MDDRSFPSRRYRRCAFGDRIQPGDRIIKVRRPTQYAHEACPASDRFVAMLREVAAVLDPPTVPSSPHLRGRAVDVVIQDEVHHWPIPESRRG